MTNQVAHPLAIAEIGPQLALAMDIRVLPSCSAATSAPHTTSTSSEPRHRPVSGDPTEQPSRDNFQHAPSESTDDELRRLLDRIWMKRSLIIEFLKEHDVEGAFVTTVTIHEDRPIYELKPATLRRLAYVGVEWSLDIFDYSE